MSDTRVLKKDKNQHIQVFVRVRPINNSEKIGRSWSILEIPSNKEILVHEKGSHSKKFTFDKAFGPSSKQIDVYNAVVSPLLEEVLAGYNCTVFAYGQTGTGKTFTMEGVNNDPTLHWQSDSSAGIIPRSLSHLFDELRTLEVQEYTVRVSFLELYNEELFDLLSSNHDTSKLRLYEDASKKGSVIIHGLEEITVHNKNEVYKILEKGSEKRQTAATLMNAHSSRSHTVFSITIHIKENNVDGEELLKTGKLNLVDLAGSENIGRSGAVDKRAKEAGSINQSLLTLGRVITALVERAPHIPYRESKLTRLLQESLGGRTKTSIIATVSPASANYEETLSTLDYAHRAKNITNRPEINQKLSKKALLKEYTEEIERLRRDLLAAHERNGVYLAQENYNDMMSLIENQTKEIGEKINHIKVLQETMETKEQIFSELQEIHNEQVNQLHKTKEELESTTHALKSTAELLQKTEREKEEQSYLVEKHVLTEKQLLSQAQTLLSVADNATTDVTKLHDKISHKRQLEQENEHLCHQFRVNIAQQFQNIETDVATHMQTQLQFLACIKDDIDAHVALSKREVESMIRFVADDIVGKGKSALDEFANNLHNSHKHYRQILNTEMERFTGLTDHECKFLNDMVLDQKSGMNSAVEANNLQIAGNLRCLSENVCRKFDELLAHTCDSIRLLGDYRLRERDDLCKSIAEIKKSVQAEREKDAKVMEEKERLEETVQNFATAFEGIQTQYESMRLQFTKFNENMNDNYSTKCATVSRVNEVCDSVTENSGDYCRSAIERNETLQREIQSDIDRLKSDVQSGMGENWTFAEQVAANSRKLVDDLQANVNNRCDVLAQNKLRAESDIKQMGQKLEEHNSSCIESVKNISNIIVEGGGKHSKHLEDLNKMSLQRSMDLGDKIDGQRDQTLDWNERTLTQVLSIQDRIGKFFNDDMRRDTPTGLTPARKEYRYPRKLITTSPHERIIQRFREFREFKD